MNDLERYALIGTAILAPPAIVAIILAALAQQAAQYVLMLTVSGPGTVDIATGTHSYPGPTEVTVTAIPSSGYQSNWNLNGVDVEQGVNTYSVYVNGVVTLGVYFTPMGPPHGVIAGIRSVGTVGTLQNLGYYADGSMEGIDLAECDEAWSIGYCQAPLMQFKVYDQGGVGIPDISVAVYPDINPDDTLFKANAMFDTVLSGPFNPGYNDVNSPLYLITDSEGLVSFRIRNLYGAEGLFIDVSQASSGYGQQLSKSTGVYAFKFPVFPGPITGQNVNPIYKSLAAGRGWLWGHGGGGGTVQYNRNIRADIVGSAFYTIQPILVSFTSKWIGNPLLP